ncbi:hypothetical protein L7F22_046250 [Adiantum nelumboides]|nr:hypothetical protein [Adiantum nelumboides]
MEDGKANVGSQAKVAEEELKVKDSDWRWPTHEKWYCMMEGVWKTKQTTSTVKDKSQQDGLQCPFEVTTLLKDANEDLSEVLVKLRSPHLITTIRKYLPQVTESLCCAEPDVDANDLFSIRDSLQHELEAAQDPSIGKDKDIQVDGSNGVLKGLKEEAASNSEDLRVGGSNVVCKEESVQQGYNESADGKRDHIVHHGSDTAYGVCDGEDKLLANLHLQHLLRFLDAQYKDVVAKFTWTQREGLVSYNMLWAFLTPGCEVRRLCDISGQACHAVVVGRGKYDHKSWEPQNNGFKMKLKVTDFNGESFRHCTMKYKIREFDGEMSFASLLVCPWSFFPNEKQHDLADHLRHRGQLFYNYAVKEPFRFMHFRGSLGFYERDFKGCFQLRRINADGRVMVDLLSLARANPDWPLANAQPPSELLRDVAEMELEVTEKRKQPTEEQLRSAPAFVYGFSFSLKIWGCFDVGGLKEITFEDRAYEKLVMKSAKQKEMLKAIVTSHLSVKKDRARLDVVAQKGEGCVVLCFGPPGTGKTLTAESLAETLHGPLWAISAFELGEEAGDLEKSLSQVLTTALRWRAVVLLDEADGYLERRAFNVDVKRNLMTCVFLRLLEYYAGVLFLTTNRVGTFDEAFLSRISLCIRYPPLDDGRRRLVWQNLLTRGGIAISEDNLNSLLQFGQPLNGREIRNVISLAQTWAESRSKPALTLDDVHDALQLVISGSKELQKDLESSTDAP